MGLTQFNLKLTVKRFKDGKIPRSDVTTVRELFKAHNYEASKNSTSTDIWEVKLIDGSKVIFGGLLDGVREYTDGAIILPVTNPAVWDFVYKIAVAARLVLFSPQSYLIIHSEEQRSHIPDDFLKVFKVVHLTSGDDLQKHFDSVA